MIAVCDRHDDLRRALGAPHDDAVLTTTVVSFTDDPARLAAYRDHLGVDVRIVADPDRALYRSAGAGRGRLVDVWSIGTLRLYVRLIRGGRRLRDLRLLADDTRQLGADLIVDPDGRVAHAWLPDGPDHRPTVDEIAEVLAELRARREPG